MLPRGGRVGAAGGASTFLCALSGSARDNPVHGTGFLNRPAHGNKSNGSSRDWPAQDGTLAMAIGMTREIMPYMTAQLTVDSAGRIALPKPLRKELDIGPRDLLELENVGERITLRPIRGTAPIAKEKGVWVFRAGQPLAASVTDNLLEQIREERDQQNLGVNRPASL